MDQIILIFASHIFICSCLMYYNTIYITHVIFYMHKSYESIGEHTTPE